MATTDGSDRVASRDAGNGRPHRNHRAPEVHSETESGSRLWNHPAGVGRAAKQFRTQHGEHGVQLADV